MFQSLVFSYCLKTDVNGRAKNGKEDEENYCLCRESAKSITKDICGFSCLLLNNEI